MQEIHLANSGPFLYIVDCRPKSFAVANIAAGGGYESPENYPTCRIEFMGVDNIHGMRESYLELVKAVNLGGDISMGWNSLLDASSWMKHISIILQSTLRVVDIVERENCSVLIHWYVSTDSLLCPRVLTL